MLRPCSLPHGPLWRVPHSMAATFPRMKNPKGKEGGNHCASYDLITSALCYAQGPVNTQEEENQPPPPRRSIRDPAPTFPNHCSVQWWTQLVFFLPSFSFSSLPCPLPSFLLHLISHYTSHCIHLMVFKGFHHYSYFCAQNFPPPSQWGPSY